MDIETLREYCLQKAGVSEEFPFGETTLVFKVGGKVFLLTSLERSPLQFNVKCDPEKAVELREQYEGVLPGYHMNKKHWNTVLVNGTVPERMLRELIDHSYELITAALPGKTRKSSPGKKK